MGFGVVTAPEVRGERRRSSIGQELWGLARCSMDQDGRNAPSTTLRVVPLPRKRRRTHRCGWPQRRGSSPAKRGRGTTKWWRGRYFCTEDPKNGTRPEGRCLQRQGAAETSSSPQIGAFLTSEEDDAVNGNETPAAGRKPDRASGPMARPRGGPAAAGGGAARERKQTSGGAARERKQRVAPRRSIRFRPA